MAQDTLRGTILEEARSATEGDRNRLYGDPTVQLELAGHIKQLIHNFYKDYGSRYISPAEWEATEAEITKISRRILGPTEHRDNYIDSAAYAAIAGECALRSARLEEQAKEHDLPIDYEPRRTV